VGRAIFTTTVGGTTDDDSPSSSSSYEDDKADICRRAAPGEERGAIRTDC
jgi:hypothetical protein